MFLKLFKMITLARRLSYFFFCNCPHAHEILILKIVYLFMWCMYHPFSSVAQSCLTLCDPMDHSTPGLPVHHQLLELIQTHAHRVSDSIRPSRALLSPSPPICSLHIKIRVLSLKNWCLLPWELYSLAESTCFSLHHHCLSAGQGHHTHLVNDWNSLDRRLVFITQCYWMTCHYTACLFLYNQQVVPQNHTDVVKNKFYPVSALATTLQSILQVLWTLVYFFFPTYSMILKTSTDAYNFLFLQSFVVLLLLYSD